MLAGISVEYLTRLEQGRDRNPSPQVIGALADALQLTRGERLLLRLAIKAMGGNALCPAGDPPDSVRPTVQALLDRLEPTPGVLLNWLGDIIAYTAGYERLAKPLGLLDGESPNLLRYIFTDDRAEDAFPRWTQFADQHVAALKANTTIGDPYATEFATILAAEAGARFTDRFAAVTAVPEPYGTVDISHAVAGELSLVYETLDLADSSGLQLLVYLPADEATSAALDHLNGRHPGALRAVSG